MATDTAKISDAIGKIQEGLGDLNTALDNAFGAVDTAIAGLDERLAAVEDGTVDPTPPDPPDPPDPEPPATDPWPSGWDDPRFTNMTEKTGTQKLENNDAIHRWSITATDPGDKGQGAIWRNGGPFSFSLCRMKCREGPRVGSSGIYTFEDFYVEAAGTGDDHSDGLQVYAPRARPTLICRRFKIVMKKGSNNAGFFSADHAEAIITLEDFYIDGTEASAAHGALWLPVDSKNADFGCKVLSVSNGILKGQKHRNPFEPGPSFAGITIQRWDNIRDERGNPIPRPF